MELPPAQSPPQQLPLEARWCVADRRDACVLLEVADEPQEQRLGLMQRPALPPLRGMWFPFRPSRPLRFWMFNTIAPLDMVFVRDGQVLAIQRDVPTCRAQPCPSYWADADGNGRADFADGVIELGAGEATRLGIKVGLPVRIESIAPVVAPRRSASTHVEE